MGITLAAFKVVGYIPEEKERLNISTNCFEISFLSSFNILVGVLFEPKHFLSLSEEILEIASPLSVGLKERINIFTMKAVNVIIVTKNGKIVWKHGLDWPFYALMLRTKLY